MMLYYTDGDDSYGGGGNDSGGSVAVAAKMAPAPPVFLVSPQSGKVKAAIPALGADFDKAQRWRSYGPPQAL